LNGLGVETSMAQALDTRDLNRGPISAKDFDRARRERYRPTETVRALNALRDRHPAMKSKVLLRLRTDQPDVLAMIRKGERSLVALSNLSGEARTVRLSKAELEAALGPLDEKSRIRDLFRSELEGAPREAAAAIEGDSVAITLQPYEHVLM
jgi:hypothetical protein